MRILSAEDLLLKRKSLDQIVTSFESEFEYLVNNDLVSKDEGHDLWESLQTIIIKVNELKFDF